MMVAARIFLILLFTGSGILALAQRAQEVFGKNRIQYRAFEWHYISGENFDLYYYDARRQTATEALQYLEAEFDRITDLIGYPPYFKTKVFLYNSLADLRQSNVGLNDNPYTLGGETVFIKPYVEVAHLGTAQELKEELLYKISDLMINEMMYGGNLKDVFQSSFLMNIPEWFVSGASLYVSKGWTVEMDDFIRQLIKTKRAKKFTRLTGNEAAFVGQSIWNYIAEKYGKSSVANILNYTRLTRNEEKSVLITLGVSYKQLVSDWHRYYANMEDQVSKSYLGTADSLRTIKADRHTQLTTIKVSPDGNSIAYAENNRGKYVVKVQSIYSGKDKTILRGGSKVIGQRVDYSLPIISWVDLNTLGVIAVKNGLYNFWLYDLSTNTKIPRELERFSNIRSIDFSSNGRLAVLSADAEGQNDLYLLSTRRDRIRRLTNDDFDDLDPSFIPGSSKIVFSSNRTLDTLKPGYKKSLAELTDNHNLFLFDLDSTTNVLTRVTNTLSKDFDPIALNEDVFYYLSDQRGIINLFRYQRSTGIYNQVTNYSASIKNYDLNANQNVLAMISTTGMRENIFVDRNFNINRQVFTPSTRRKELQQARVIQERRKQEENKKMSVKDLINARMKEVQGIPDSAGVKQDSVLTQPDSLTIITPDSIALVVDTVKLNADSVSQKQQNVVSTDNYVFEDEAVKQTRPTESFLTRYMKARDNTRITGPFPYESKFSANNFITSFLIDPLRGWGVQMEVQMNDMLENFRISGGIMTSIDLRNGDVFAEFQYLPAWIDFSARFDRKGIRWDPFITPENVNQPISTFHYSLNRFEVGASAPLNDRFRVALKPFVAHTRSADQGSSYNSGQALATPTDHFYAGINSEFVYDNSVSSGLNIIEGTRGKIMFTHYQGLDNEDLSFSRISADIRHYQPLYKEIVLAVRGFAGTFYGRSPKLFLLGGMDNWAFNETDVSGRTAKGESNPLGITGENQDVLFVEYATSVRGFDYATLFGNTAMLMNAEFRVPIIRALTNAPITSNFFRNLQFIGFYDIGTSWSGEPPFSSGQSVSNAVIDSPPFQIEIKNFLNPWIYSYGVGMRTVMLGYYMKFDLAWPVQNYEVGNPRLFVTIGIDF